MSLTWVLSVVDGRPVGGCMCVLLLLTSIDALTATRVGVKGCAFGSKNRCAKRLGNEGPGNGKGAVCGGKGACRKRCVGNGHRKGKACAFRSKRGCIKR